MSEPAVSSQEVVRRETYRKRTLHGTLFRRVRLGRDSRQVAEPDEVGASGPCHGHLDTFTTRPAPELHVGCRFTPSALGPAAGARWAAKRSTQRPTAGAPFGSENKQAPWPSAAEPGHVYGVQDRRSQAKWRHWTCRPLGPAWKPPWPNWPGTGSEWVAALLGESDSEEAGGGYPIPRPSGLWRRSGAQARAREAENPSGKAAVQTQHREAHPGTEFARSNRLRGPWGSRPSLSDSGPQIGVEPGNRPSNTAVGTTRQAEVLRRETRAPCWSRPWPSFRSFTTVLDRRSRAHRAAKTG